jgi:hypothetical protein
MLTGMTATIIPFPPRRALPARTASVADQARGRRAGVGTNHRADQLGSRGEDHWTTRAHRVLDHVDAMLHDGAGGQVVALCEQAMRCLLDSAADIADGRAVSALIDRLRRLHLHACRLDPPDPVQLAEFVYGLAMSDEVGVLAGVLDPYVPLLGPVGLAHVRRRVREDEDRMRSMNGPGRQRFEVRLRPIAAALARAHHPSVV